jgi:hypothetical protein
MSGSNAGRLNCPLDKHLTAGRFQERVRTGALPWLYDLQAAHPRLGEVRTPLPLDRNAPIFREVEPPSHGRVIAIPQVGGLHHRCMRAA